MVMWTENGNWGDYVCANTLSTHHVCEKPASSQKPTVKEGKSIIGFTALAKHFNLIASGIFK